MIDEKFLLIQDKTLTTIFVFILVISILTTQNQILILDNKKPLFDKKTESNIIILCKVIVLFLIIGYIKIDLKNLEIAKFKQKDCRSLQVQLFASSLSLLVAIIVLFSSINKRRNSDIISSLENPYI